MTEISFQYSSEGVLVGISARGHAEDAPRGESVVCAGISTVFELLLAGAKDLPARAVSFREDQQSAEREFAVDPEGLSESSWQQFSLLLQSARRVLEDMAENHPRHCSIC